MAFNYPSQFNQNNKSHVDYWKQIQANASRYAGGERNYEKRASWNQDILATGQQNLMSENVLQALQLGVTKDFNASKYAQDLSQKGFLAQGFKLYHPSIKNQNGHMISIPRKQLSGLIGFKNPVTHNQRLFRDVLRKMRVLQSLTNVNKQINKDVLNLDNSKPPKSFNMEKKMTQLMKKYNVQDLSALANILNVKALQRFQTYGTLDGRMKLYEDNYKDNLNNFNQFNFKPNDSQQQQQQSSSQTKN